MVDRILIVKIIYSWKVKNWIWFQFPVIFGVGLHPILIHILCYQTFLTRHLTQEEVDTLKREGYWRGEEKRKWAESLRSWAFDADGKWKQLPWKPNPASNESMRREKENRVNGGMRESEFLTKRYISDLPNLRHRNTYKKKAAVLVSHVTITPPKKSTCTTTSPQIHLYLKSLFLLLIHLHGSPQHRAPHWGWSPQCCSHFQRLLGFSPRC